MSENENDTRVARLAARRRGERALWVATLKRLAPLVGIVVLAAIYGSNGTASADEAVTPPHSPVSASAPAERYTVVVELPEHTGDATAADLLVEVYARRLIDRGFVPAREACDCLTGPADDAAEVRAEIEIDYPGAWVKAFYAPAPVAGQQI